MLARLLFMQYDADDFYSVETDVSPFLHNKHELLLNVIIAARNHFI